MDWKKKWRFRLFAGLQVLAAAAMAGISAWLLYCYAQYGERSMETEADRKEAAALPGMIRVQITGDSFKEVCHESVTLTCDETFTIMSGDRSRLTESSRDSRGTMQSGHRVGAGDCWTITAEEFPAGQALCAVQEDGVPITVASLKRADGPPRYTGRLFLYLESDGIVLVNELPLEEYLCGVVASEMPSAYPLEAQKAQAVCARTYACSCIRLSEEKHVFVNLDDSVNDQVYNNYSHNERSDEAVHETEGEILPLDEVQYYSTSCQTEHREDLDSDEAFERFLEQEPDGTAEYGSPWLRWEVSLSLPEILAAVPAQREPEGPLEIRVARRAGNGQAQMLEICGESESIQIEGEYRIREVLSPEHRVIRLMDGQEISGMHLLPSAFFWLETDAAEKETGKTSDTDAGQKMIKIHGGGYGHGRGMSQNGAAALAQEGLGYREILEYYYQCEVSSTVSGE